MQESTINSVNEIIISADSHVQEKTDLWVKGVTSSYRDQVPQFPERREGMEHHPGGHDPHERIKEMEVDGLSAEVLYPTRCLKLYGVDDPGLQEECFKVYNDWLIDYCQVAPKRLVGVPAISAYNIDHAVQELERCVRLGLKGALIWQVPPFELRLSSSHYDRFWAAAQDLGAPVSLHTLTGRSLKESKHWEDRRGIENYRRSANLKVLEGANALFDLIFYGVLERYPRLKIVIVENEIGWIPFMLQQWDYYYRRTNKVEPLPITMEPSQYFRRQVYVTFIKDSVYNIFLKDAVRENNLDWWGIDNCMWSSDFPHLNSTWPDSRKLIERDMGQLPAEVREKLLSRNVAKLYNVESPQLN